jgi:hypothetical protein
MKERNFIVMGAVLLEGTGGSNLKITAGRW